MKENLTNEMASAHIKQLRAKTGLTQEEFCETFGLNLNTYRHWERGDRKPTGSSLVLLKLIEESFHEVLSIMNKIKGDGPIMSDGKTLILQSLEQERFFTFDRFVKESSFISNDAICALIKANGFPFVNFSNNKGKVLFSAGYETEDMKDVFWINNNDNMYGGDLKNVIEKTYSSIYAIEVDLQDAIYWTQEMRNTRIVDIIDKIGIDNDFFNNILRNW
ncbi:helix-turn-helix domain-containing protein [Enterobacter cloacae]|uniref:helix-turn-helix domain-containing protein n=1 Tax=Enterobacter cloacae TaxID=550 RepID=UPI0032AF4CD2